MVSEFESGKDLIQELIESGAQRVGEIVGIVARSVREVAHEATGGTEKVAGIATIIAGTVREVTREIGDWISDGIEMREAANAAREDYDRKR
jgi:hypothetical protein